MELNPKFCIESGDLFSFVGGKNEEDAAKWFIFKIIRIRDATLGETIIVREDYQGKKLATFKTEDLLLDQSRLKFQKEGNRIHFTRTPFPRSSRAEAWQGVFHKGESMMQIGKCHWIAEGLTKNPITGELPET